jgi:hypothetical protein
VNGIRVHDALALVKSIFSPVRLGVLLLAIYGSYMVMQTGYLSWWIGIAGMNIALGWFIFNVSQEFQLRKFKSRDSKQLWDSISDRVKRLKQAIQKSPSHIQEILFGLPKRVEATAKSLYVSLRNADLLKHEIIKSEGLIPTGALPFGVRTTDSQTNELYSLADKNAHEYGKRFKKLTSRITRVEGQCAVFISALDMLRVELLGMKLEKQDRLSNNDEIVQSVKDMQTQLESINKALQEIESLQAEVFEREMPETEAFKG